MPGYHAAVTGWLVENLIVPETHRAPEELRRSHQERWIPEQIMKPFGDPPSSQSMKESLFRISRFVGMVFVKESIVFVNRFNNLCQLCQQHLDLFVCEQSYPSQIPMGLVEPELLSAQTVNVPVARLSGSEKIADRLVMQRQILDHLNCFL